jgi:hypothetical protein
MDEICGANILKNSFMLNKQALGKFEEEGESMLSKFLQSEQEYPTSEVLIFIP